MITQNGLSDNCVLDYFGTLYEMASDFSCAGIDLARRKGFCSRAWVEAFFRKAAENHCFANESCPQGLPFQAIRPLITDDIIALFCLANDILEAAFYEHQLLQQQKIVNTWPSDKTNRQLLQRLRLARRKFLRQKKLYLELAYGHGRAQIVEHIYDVTIEPRVNSMQRDIRFALDIMPIVVQTHPRDDHGSDRAPLNKLCRKHARLFTIATDRQEASRFL